MQVDSNKRALSVYAVLVVSLSDIVCTHAHPPHVSVHGHRPWVGFGVHPTVDRVRRRGRDGHSGL